ncbi:MAG: AAA family ATPase [Desulfovibrionales bacterium]|nr:AAA family ATPase [Desulfovibrionales bacterium]
MTTDGNKLMREISALILACLLALVTLALYSYAPADPGFNHQAMAGHKTQNLVGIVGAYMASALVDLCGGAAWLWPVFMALAAGVLFFRQFRPAWWRWLGGAILSVMLPVWIEHGSAALGLSGTGMAGGGFVGRSLEGFFQRNLGGYGFVLVGLCLTLIGARLLIGIPFRVLTEKFHSARAGLVRIRERFRQWAGDEPPAPVPGPPPRPVRAERPKARPVPAEPREERSEPKPVAKPVRIAPAAQAAGVLLPPLDLLAPVPASRVTASKAVLDRQSQSLTACFADFGIQGEVQGVQPGPVITMFEFKPAPGIKVSRIAGMGDDLALALKARAVRIVAPLPGRDTVGIEIPNEQRQAVYLREILDDPIFAEAKAQLPLALGKDIQGKPRIADLARMPHMLVAGATGAGKSVCLNCLLLSLVYKHDPEHVKLLLIDPKRIELAVYGTLPHLVHPVVTDMHLAKNALEWAVYEMEQRYEAMARTGVRHITTYNQKLEEMGDDRPEDLRDLKPFPYLVIVVDELADMMMTAAKEVEGSIVRLAQLARASGIHLILATQRPSVDVVTGIIKANFPSRIAFQVSSKHDSRTILDGIGAEHLLGQGDMLFKLSGGGVQRVHGAFVGDDEIARVVGFWEKQRPQRFELDFAEWNTGGDSGGDGNGGASDVLDDPKYAEAIDFVTDQGRASISMIQRRLRIGFNRAARFIEQMEMDGIIGPQDGSKPRTVRKKD